jgi:hypothetical protein
MHRPTRSQLLRLLLRFDAHCTCKLEEHPWTQNRRLRRQNNYPVLRPISY